MKFKPAYRQGRPAYQQGRFKNLNIWQKAMELGEDINTLSIIFPKKEIYNLTSQIRKVADSIALTISEGSIGKSNAELKNLLDMLFAPLQGYLHAYVKQRSERLQTSDSGQQSSVFQTLAFNNLIHYIW